MSSYFDEHATNDTEYTFIEAARALLNSLRFDEMDEGTSSLLDRLGRTPPTSEKYISELEAVTPKKDTDCAICLKSLTKGKKVVQLLCDHPFHEECILPWLKSNSTCPMCRASLPTDDAVYEEIKLTRERLRQHEERVQDLHDSMYG